MAIGGVYRFNRAIPIVFCAYELLRNTQQNADFAPLPPPGDLHKTTLTEGRLVPPPGELDETYASALIWAYSRKITRCMAKPSLSPTGILLF